MEKENKSQLAKDLANALFICHLRDDLSELVDDKSIDPDVRKRINTSYLAAVALLACAIVDSKHIQVRSGR